MYTSVYSRYERVKKNWFPQKYPIITVCMKHNFPSYLVILQTANKYDGEQIYY